MAAVHKRKGDALLDSLTDGRHRTYFRSCADKNAAAWLLAIPGSRKKGRKADGTRSGPFVVMPNANFKMAAQKRLRHRITPRPPNVVQEDFRCTQCQRLLDEYGEHAQSCLKLSGHRTWRHSQVVETLATQARRARQHAICVEPNMMQSGFTWKEGVPRTGSNPTLRRGDMSINKDDNNLRNPDRTLMVDVNITSPFSGIKENEEGPVVRTLAGKVEAGDGRKQGAAAEAAAQKKNRLYLDKWNISKEQFFPFVMETSGFMHPRAVDLVGEIARMQFEYKKSQFPEGQLIKQSSIGSRYRGIIERVAVVQQLGDSRLTLLHLQLCIPPQGRAAAGRGR
jgi:hypothetical protein